MTHDEILRDLEKLIAAYEQAAMRLAKIDAFDDEYWPLMRELRAHEVKIASGMKLAAEPVDRWFAARDEYLASINGTLQGSNVE